MDVNLDCIPCLMQQALKTARLATDDEAKQELILRKTADLLKDFSYEYTPPQVAREVYDIIREVSGNDDPFKKIKKHDNALALEIYPWAKKKVESSNDSLFTAIKLAVAGNILDYGVNKPFDLEETISRVLDTNFAVNDYGLFLNELSNANTIAYLADNAGELVFDRLLIEQFSDKNVFLFVKSTPIINDATMADVKQVGLEDKVHVDFVDDRSDHIFLKKLRSSDLVISKGQGNFESLNEESYVFFLLMAKCHLVASHLNVNEGDFVFSRGFG